MIGGTERREHSVEEEVEAGNEGRRKVEEKKGKWDYQMRMGKWRWEEEEEKAVRGSRRDVKGFYKGEFKGGSV